MKSYSLITVLSLAAAANAHFTLEYPASRGDNDQSQATGPCGGLNTPSDTRTPWGLEGGVLRFEAGHDEANTAVYLALGNNPTTEDFNITLAPKFLQTGLGTFCWNSLVIPEGTAGIEDGVNATIQVVQEGHTGGGLYNVCLPYLCCQLHRLCHLSNIYCSAPISPSSLIPLSQPPIAQTPLALVLKLLQILMNLILAQPMPAPRLQRPLMRQQSLVVAS